MIDAKHSLCGTMLALLLWPASARTETAIQVEKLHNQGKTAFAKKDYDKVIAACEHYYRGTVCASLMEYARAITDYQEAVRLDPRYCQANFALAYLFANCPKAQLRDRQKALDYARKGCGPPARKEREEYEITAHSFELPIYYKPNRRETLQKIRLFVSKDRGKSWSRFKDYTPCDNRIIFTALHDGSYWFAVQEVLKDGRIMPAKHDDLPPAMKVYVNTGRCNKTPEKQVVLLQAAEFSCRAILQENSAPLKNSEPPKTARGFRQEATTIRIVSDLRGNEKDPAKV